MKTRNLFTAVVFFALGLVTISCNQATPKEAGSLDIEKKEINYMSYTDDVSFMKEHTDVITLTDASGKAKVAVAPKLQGRVMTSSADGENGRSFGWINRELFTSGEKQEHIHIFGGEERFWLGPEGGQNSIFFKKGAEFTLDDWYTPKLIDTESFNIKSVSQGKATFTKKPL